MSKSEKIICTVFLVVCFAFMVFNCIQVDKFVHKELTKITYDPGNIIFWDEVVTSTTTNLSEKITLKEENK